MSEKDKQDAPENGVKKDARKFLSREEMLSAQDVVVEEVFVEPWNGWVWVRGLTGKQRDRFEDEVVQVKKGGKVQASHFFRAKLVALAVVDGPQTLQPVFTENDVRALAEKSAKALSVIFDKARDLSGLTPEDVEELTEGFDEAPTGGSSTG